MPRTDPVGVVRREATRPDRGPDVSYGRAGMIQPHKSPRIGGFSQTIPVPAGNDPYCDSVPEFRRKLFKSIGLRLLTALLGQLEYAD